METKRKFIGLRIERTLYNKLHEVYLKGKETTPTLAWNQFIQDCLSYCLEQNDNSQDTKQNESKND